MKFSTLLTLPLVALAAASPFDVTHMNEKRVDKAPQVIKFINKLPGDIQKLNATLNEVPPNAAMINFFTLVQIQEQSDQISYDIGNATKAAKSSTAFSKANSKTISNKIIALKPKIFSLLNNFVRHKKAFDNQGVTGAVVNGLKKQRGQTQAQGKALGAKLAPPYKAGAPGNTTQIVNAFNQAIKKLS